MKSGWTQSARLLGSVQGVVVQAIILVEGSSSSGKFMMTGGEGGSGGRRGRGKGERSGQRVSEGKRQRDGPSCKFGISKSTGKKKKPSRLYLEPGGGGEGGTGDVFI